MLRVFGFLLWFSSSLASDQMNGIKIRDYAGFEKDWRLVTVRFRKDTQEMRWTFANDVAWRVLQSGRTEYPDGAVFAKIGVATSEDSLFTSSAVPNGTRRYQFMLRNSSKYAETGGWGYALFDVDGKTFPDDPHSASQACFACHQLASVRGQVFSQPSQLAPFVKTVFLSQGEGFHQVQFTDIKRTSLPESVVSHIPKKVDAVRIVSNKELTEHLFQGTLDEIKPSLELEARNTRRPALLLSADGERFSLVIPLPASKNCKAERHFKSIMSLPEKNTPPLASEYCNP